MPARAARVSRAVPAPRLRSRLPGGTGHPQFHPLLAVGGDVIAGFRMPVHFRRARPAVLSSRPARDIRLGQAD